MREEVTNSYKHSSLLPCRIYYDCKKNFTAQRAERISSEKKIILILNDSVRSLKRSKLALHADLEMEKILKGGY